MLWNVVCSSVMRMHRIFFCRNVWLTAFRPVRNVSVELNGFGDLCGRFRERWRKRKYYMINCFMRVIEFDAKTELEKYSHNNRKHVACLQLCRINWLKMEALDTLIVVNSKIPNTPTWTGSHQTQTSHFAGRNPNQHVTRLSSSSTFCRTSVRHAALCHSNLPATNAAVAAASAAATF